ncbi:hypothetical protein HW532_01745 [Kaustia mangrovi]|uniref:Uncharacterized protein n=1 Tax=Kaustia mangrovi TaxID=2593653 RepID=A0A7S8C1H3_9HYPH|nr:hypothetical protein [Kaustia mangrovi]QPC41557.1 hypothetical protein HW532_01745 [Kaustia mangrovi]
MNEQLQQIPDLILGLAKVALTQANTHAVYMDPGNEHWPLVSVLNAAHAGELFLKAIIAREHPLLIFRDIFGLDDYNSDELDLKTLLARGRTHDFEKLPQVLWATTGRRIPHADCYERLRRARNAVQHFCPPDELDFSRLSLEFIYTIIDPLISDYFDLYAIEYHEDHSVSYDYVVAVLLRRQLRFSVPPDFAITEVDLREELQGASDSYRAWFSRELERIGKASLIGS